MTDELGFPKGWDEERVRRLVEHYESQTEEQAVAEDEADFEDESHTFVDVPNELLPEIRRIIARHRAG